MARTGTELGLKSPVRLRVGIDIETIRGVNKEGDPGSISDAELQEAINIRILPSGAAVSRGGQERVNADALDSCVYGIVDDEVKAAGPFWWLGTGGTVDGSAFVGLNTIDPVNSVLDYAIDHSYSYGGFWSCATVYGGQIVFIAGQGGTFQLRSWDPETESSTLIHDFVIAPGECHGMAVAGANLYIPIKDGTAAGVKMYVWNGAVMVLDHTFAPSLGASGGLAMSFGGEAYFAYSDNDGPNEVWRRVAGVWTSLAMPAVARFSCSDWVEYSGKLYMCGANYNGSRSGVILSYDGATLVLEHQMGDPFVDLYAITALATDGTTLFYAHDGIIAPFGVASRIGTYDGLAFVDNVKDFIDQFGQNVTDNSVSAMFTQNGRVYVCGGSYLIKGSGNPVFVIRSPVNTIDADWQVLGRIFTFLTNQQKAYV
jgi:hypothetical protein